MLVKRFWKLSKRVYNFIFYSETIDVLLTDNSYRCAKTLETLKNKNKKYLLKQETL